MKIIEALKRDGVKTKEDIFYIVKPNGDYYSHKEFIDGKGVLVIPDLFMYDDFCGLYRLHSCKLSNGEWSEQPHGEVKEYRVLKMYTGKTYLDLMDGICSMRYHAKVCAVYKKTSLLKTIYDKIMG